MTISTVRFLVLDYQGDCTHGRPLRARWRAAQYLAGLADAERARLAARMAWVALQRERPGADLRMLNLRDEHAATTAAMLDELRAIAGGEWPAMRWYTTCAALHEPQSDVAHGEVSVPLARAG